MLIDTGLYLSDVLPTSYHSVCDTGVFEGDSVAIWGLGPIGLMACVWAFKKGAKRVVGIDNNWRTEFAKQRIPGLETINYEELKKQSIPQKIHELIPGGVDACIEASGGEYAKTWTHKIEMLSGIEQDTSEMINECIYSTRKFGRVGIIGDYTGCKMLRQLWSVDSDSSRYRHQSLQRWCTHGAWHQISGMWAGARTEM